MSAGRGPSILPAGADEAHAAALLALQAGGIVGLPTETVYGLGVLPQPAPLSSLIEVKRRSADKGIALLIDDIDQVDGLVAVPTAAGSLAAAFWPGPLTLVLPLLAGAHLPEAVTGGRSTLGVRVPDHAVPRSLARDLGPLAVTSANRSGEPPAVTAAQLVASVGASLALVLDDGPVAGGVASTVVAVDETSKVQVLRVGALSTAAIDDAIARSI